MKTPLKISIKHLAIVIFFAISLNASSQQSASIGTTSTDKDAVLLMADPYGLTALQP